MGSCTECGQCLLILLNIIFVLISMNLIAVGVLMRYFPGKILQFLYNGLSGINDEFFKVPDGTGDMQAVPLFNDLGTVLVCLGFVIFLTTFFACCGAGCRWRPLLLLYCVCVLILIIAIGAVGGLFLNPTSPMNNRVKLELHKEVYKRYKGPQNEDVFSLLTNIMSFTLQCCGMDGPHDFNSNASWANYTLPYENRTIQIDVTPACCTPIALESQKIEECAVKNGTEFNPNLTNTMGCYDRILEVVTHNKQYSMIAIFGLIGLLFAELLFAVALISDIGDNEISPV